MKCYPTMFLAAAALLAGCGDDSKGGGSSDVDAADVLPVEDASVPDAAPEPEPDAAPEPEPDAAPPPPPDAALPPPPDRILVEISPRKPVFALADAPTADADVQDAFADTLGDAEDFGLLWRLEPPALGAVEVVDGDPTLVFAGQGPGTLFACLPDDSLCGQTTLYVDDGPPLLEVDSPVSGAILGGDGEGATIAVRGRASDSGGTVSVRVNGEVLDLTPEGAFSIDLPAEFGVNRVEVVAEDGVQLVPSRVVRDVLWAPRYLPVEPERVAIVPAVQAIIGQPLLDDDAVVALPEGEGLIAAEELAAVVVALIGLGDATSLLDALEIDSSGVTLRVLGVRLGEPEVDIALTDTGLDLFVRLGSIEVDVEGGVELEGEGIDLTGTLDVAVAAFARFDTGLTEDGALDVQVAEVTLAVERVGGRFADPGAQALVSTLGSVLRDTVEDLALGLIESLVREELPVFLIGAIEGLLSALSEIPLNLDVGLPGVPNIDLALAMQPIQLQASRRADLRIGLEAEIALPEPLEAPYEDPGVPDIGDPEVEPALPDTRLGLTLRLAVFNAILHEIWRLGLLRIEAPIPDDLPVNIAAVRLDGRLPPVLVKSPPGAPLPFEAQIGALQVTVTTDPEQPPDVYDMSARAGLGISLAGGRLQLTLDGDPDISAELVASGAARPALPPEALEALIASIVWPLATDALGGALDFSIDAIEVDVAAIQGFVPRLQSLALRPVFGGSTRVEDGWIIIEGALGVELGVAAP